jgi:hypothetical protein
VRYLYGSKTGPKLDGFTTACVIHFGELQRFVVLTNLAVILVECLIVSPFFFNAFIFCNNEAVVHYT